MATDELRLNNLGACHWLCPACGSDDWKSAKLVILENTTNIVGSGQGNVTDPGMFSGSGREFFLSERWFSWSNPIDLHFASTATTKLVDEVKNFMLSYSDRLGTTQKRPVRPDERVFFRGYEEPVPPKRRALNRVTILEPPVKPDAPERRTFKQHVRDLWTVICAMIGITFLAIAISSFFVDLTVEWVIFITVTAFLVMGIPAYRDLPKTTYEGKLKEYEKLQEKYLKTKSPEQEYREEREAYRRSRARYLHRREEYEAEVRRYEAAEGEYAGRVKHIESLRELVWQSARVCMRCGKCYLGERIY